MRKLLTIIILAASVSALAQAPTLQQKLYYTCKVWGFVKYYHSNVSTCGVNWDSVLVSVLPAVRSASTAGQFNDALDTMLAAAGPMTLSTTYFPDTLPAELKRNRDWSWISDPVLRTDVQVQLDTIKNNFRPHASCWVENNTYTTPNVGWLLFPNDSLGVNTYSHYPDSDSLVLILSKFWNILRHFNPYNYVLDNSWDSVLYYNILPASTAPNDCSFSLAFRKIATALDDAHAYGFNGSTMCMQVPGFYRPRIRLKYLAGEGRYVVVKSKIPGINPGDAILSLDGLTPAQWEDSLRPYIPAGNNSAFRRFVAGDMMQRQSYHQYETIQAEDSNGVAHFFSDTCVWWPGDPALFTAYHYPSDTLDSVKWTTLPCDIGYVNMGTLQQADVTTMYTALYNKSAIIFDLRNYPNATAWDIADRMYPLPMEYANAMTPDVNYPGTYFWAPNYEGHTPNPTPYAGKVIILMDEITWSQAEWSCMMLGRMPGAIKVGSQTMGADGNVVYWNQSVDLRGGFTGLGVFYPNGDSTQRIGIVPDSLVYPTSAGIRHHDDEVLDKALEIAGCNLHVRVNPLTSEQRISIFPNPTNDLITITATNPGADIATIELSDITGRVILSQKAAGNNRGLNTSFNMKALPGGMYFVTIRTEAGTYVRKVVKE